MSRNLVEGDPIASMRARYSDALEWAHHDQNIFNEAPNADSYAQARFFELPPISAVSNPPSVPHSVISVKSRELRDAMCVPPSRPYNEMVMSALEMIFLLNPFVMDPRQWDDDGRAHAEKYRLAELQPNARRSIHGLVHTSKGCCPVNPLHGEPAVEYTGAWVLRLSKKSERQVREILGSCAWTLEELVVYAATRKQGP
ncbi:unnamed protein product [Aphanomyces euteiches]